MANHRSDDTMNKTTRRYFLGAGLGLVAALAGFERWSDRRRPRLTVHAPARDLVFDSNDVPLAMLVQARFAQDWVLFRPRAASEPHPGELLRMTMDRELILAPGATVDKAAAAMVGALGGALEEGLGRVALQVDGGLAMSIGEGGILFDQLWFAPDVRPRKLAHELSAAWTRAFKTV